MANYDARVAIEPYEIYRREITITGSMAVLHTFDRAGALVAAGVIDPEIFVSDRFPLDSYSESLSRFRAGIGRKILIERDALWTPIDRAESAVGGGDGRDSR